LHAKQSTEVCYEASTSYGVVHDVLSQTAARVVVAPPGKLRLIYRSSDKPERADAKGNRGGLRRPEPWYSGRSRTRRLRRSSLTARVRRPVAAEKNGRRIRSRTRQDFWKWDHWPDPERALVQCMPLC
jgi:hypothetical protein